MSTHLDKFLGANSNAICRFSRVEWANSPVLVSLTTWGIPKITSIGTLACRANMKKNGASCIVELKDVFMS